MITKTITKKPSEWQLSSSKKIFEIICVNLLTTKKTLALAFYPDGEANANAKANYICLFLFLIERFVVLFR